MPRYAARMLARLVGIGKPHTTVDEFHTDLSAVRDRPAEVTRVRRNALLVLQGLLLAPGVLCLLLLVPFLLYAAVADPFAANMHGQTILVELENELPLRSASLLASTDLADRLSALALLGDNLELQRQLQLRLEQFEHDRRLVQASSSWFLRNMHDSVQTSLIKRVVTEEVRSKDEDPALAAREIISRIDTAKQEMVLTFSDWIAMAMIFAFWPTLWTIWAFLFRGGLSYRLTGIALVRKDGRPAPRWRCAWRALLVWAGPLALFLAALLLELHHIGLHWGSADPVAPSALAWLAWLAWWLAVALLLLSVWLAQRNPARGLHDVLAGTYLVPR